MDAQVIATFLDHLLIERGSSRNTVAGYQRDLARYREYLDSLGKADLAQVSENDVAGFAIWLGHPRETAEGEGPKPLSASSIARAVVSVRGLHRFAASERLVPTDVANGVKPPRSGRSLPKALSISEVQAILDAPDPTTATGLRDAALLELLYGTGARISEVLDLDVDDVTAVLNSEDLGLRLIGKGNKERLAPLGSYARAALTAWLVRGRPGWAARSAKGTPALFINSLGRRLSRQSAWAILRENAEAAALTVEVSPHTLRHSFATHLLDGGADVRVVQELLGHSSVTTTQIYTLVTVEHLREVYLTSHPRAR
ncbi:MAG: site-specific tyrosine recombinase XerD [Propionibacteriaceae bacterium]|nr:site-specific tyrosine recombinase XerD [Propionibacteriaceae bacterium]